MLSGINEAGKASSDIYLSRDGGVNWSLSDTLVVMPQEFKARGFSSIYVDKDNYMYLFGGKETNSSNVLNKSGAAVLTVWVFKYKESSWRTV